MPIGKTPHDLTLEELKHSEERFRLLVEGVQDYAIYMLDPQGIVSSWNAGAERIKGYRAEEIIGSHFSRFFRPEDRAAHRPHHALKTAASEGRYVEEGLRLRKDGSVFWASVVITALYDDTGALRGFSKVVRDITERKESERKLQEKERLATLGTTAAVFAHEIANPLNGISTSLQIAQVLLRDIPSPNPTLVETLQGALEEVERLGSLLKNYRGIARPQHLSWKPTDLARIITEVLTPATWFYNAVGVTVKLECEELSPIAADEERIKQVILNLCKNAVEAMPDGGTLTARTYEFDGRVIIEISDTGVGIPEGLDVFQIFNTTKSDGTGLGLAIVQQIVSDHHGTISYFSAPEKGTTFTLSFPANSRT